MASARRSERSTRRMSAQTGPRQSVSSSKLGSSATHGSERTNATNEHRIGRVLGVPLEGVALRDWPFREFVVRRTAHEGTILKGTKTDHGADSPGRIVPCPPGLGAMIETLPTRIDTDLLFPTPTGKMWRERNFYRDVWYPAQEASGIDIRPHECRHSNVTHLRAAGVNDADLAEIAGHRVETMISRYTHPLRRSFDEIRNRIG